MMETLEDLSLLSLPSRGGKGGVIAPNNKKE